LAQQSRSEFIATGQIVPASQTHLQRRIIMLSWALMFLVVAVIAAVLGFGVIAGTAAIIAKIFFGVFVILFVITLIFGRRGSTVI
jgi:uncharacterized membrane protein YtjA (UPF0391 family)